MSEQLKLDLDKAINVLEEALAVIEDLHLMELSVDPDKPSEGRANNQKMAEISRDLLRAGELCRLAGAEIYMKYYVLKGHPDPRENNG